MSFYPMVGTFLIALPFAILGTPDFTLLLSQGQLEFLSSNPVELKDIPFFITTAILAATGVLCVSLAFRLANAALVAPFLYTEMIWGLIFGYLLFSDVPDFWMLLGTAIIISSGLYLILVERWRPPMVATAPASAIPRALYPQKPRPWNFFDKEDS
jgi:drug/metabolite transporter (DMT)-like permease